jgi:uncharacterized membrane protein YkvA (DUF1232 family)
VGDDEARNERVVRDGFLAKARRYLGQMPLAQETVAMYFCLLDPKTPLWVKGTVAAALAYFILPLDAIPDLLPIVGFSDDAGVLAAALSAVSAHITDEHRARARGWMTAPIDVTPTAAGRGASGPRARGSGHSAARAHSPLDGVGAAAME